MYDHGLDFFQPRKHALLIRTRNVRGDAPRVRGQLSVPLSLTATKSCRTHWEHEQLWTGGSVCDLLRSTCTVRRVKSLRRRIKSTTAFVPGGRNVIKIICFNWYRSRDLNANKIFFNFYFHALGMQCTRTFLIFVIRNGRATGTTEPTNVTPTLQGMRIHLITRFESICHRYLNTHVWRRAGGETHAYVRTCGARIEIPKRTSVRTYLFRTK